MHSALKKICTKMKILKQFVSTDPDATWMNEIQREGDYLYATDAHILARVKSDEQIEIENKYDKTVNQFFESKDTYLEINKSIIHEINALPKYVHKKGVRIGDHIPCKECNESGEVEYEYQTAIKTYYHEKECPVCDGDGHNNKYKYTEIHLIKEDQYLTYKGSYFNPNLILKVFSTVDANPKIKLGTDKMIVKLGQYEFVIMAVSTVSTSVAFDIEEKNNELK